MLPSRYALSRSTTALACTSARLAPSSRSKRLTRRLRSSNNSNSNNNNNNNAAPAAADVDEVERLLAATPTTPSSALTKVPSSSSPTNTNTAAAAAAAITPASRGSSALDPISALHFNAVHGAMAHNTTTAAGGATHVQLEQIERRRSKLSVAEAEFDVGLTERLLPELPRLPALHEVHYGDAVVREIDRSVYFAEQTDERHRHTTAAAAAGAAALTASSPSSSTVVIDGKEYAEVSLDGVLSDDEFAAFDAEAAANTTTAAALPTAATNDGQAAAAAAGTPAAVVEDGGDVEEEESDAVAAPLTFGRERPWFVPASGVVALEPLSPEDCALLLRFVLHLRQQTEADLAPALRRALQQAESADSPAPTAPKTTQPQRRTLSLVDITRYLDTAPPPVIAFTESLPSAATEASSSTSPSSATTTSTAASVSSPAFVFHLYLENLSSQNAIGHLAMLYGIPQRCFQMHSAASKMSCTTLLCAVAENRLRREHLLLLNTLRHPGFVLRVSNIQEVRADRYPMLRPATGGGSTGDVSQQLFGELARWKPLYQAELLLRRVSSDTAGGSTRQQLEHRLRAVQTLGAICFCANREASLSRAATDVLHGFYRSALLNALQRKKAPMPLQRFLKRPNVATAQHAHHVSTDPSVRQVLKTFVQTNGNWQETVSRTPYVLRRRWINALRGLVWNTMASRRLRKLGRGVCLGDVVVRPELRHDVHRRGILTVKAEHVMVVRTESEAAAASLEDVFVPFLRGRYPEHLFAEEATNHPIMTRTNMLALLRSLHAPQLLLGMTDELRLILDVRAESAPLLFRRLIVRPVAMDFTILEDKPPMRSLHYDAARLLTNDRWGVAAATTAQAQTRRPQREPAAPTSGAAAAPAAPSHLLPPSEVLERTTLGSRLTSGVLAEDFFTVPNADDYVVLGHAHRHLCGGLVPSAPHSSTADVGDRVYTVHIRAVVEHNLAGLSNLLREYFLLSGIETQAESALQHKVHRLRRELDPETPLLTAAVYCTTCFNRDHDSQEQCAEYQFKRHRDAARSDVAAAVVAAVPAPALAAPAPLVEALHGEGAARKEDSRGVAVQQQQQQSTSCTVCLRLHLRRRNEEQRWGVHLTKSLGLVGMEDVGLIQDGGVWLVNDSSGVGAEGAEATALPFTSQSSPWPAAWMTEASEQEKDGVDTASGGAGDAGHEPRPLQLLLRFLRALFSDEEDKNNTTKRNSLVDRLRSSPLLTLPQHPASLQLQRAADDTTTTKTPFTAPAELKACGWTLKLVNATAVTTQRDVAAALLTQTAKSRDVWLTFETHVATPQDPRQNFTTTTSSLGATYDVVQDAVLHSTHPPNRIPQSTAALSPARRHEAETAMRAAVQRVSPATQRWLQDLPYRVTLVLAKPRRGLHENRSWGLQLDGTDMSLVNFARLMVQYMASDTLQQHEGAGNGRAVVASLAPADAFPRNDTAMLARVSAEVLPALEPLLNDAYRVVRINHTAVHHKTDAARVMTAFQASLENAEVDGNNAPEQQQQQQHFLTLALERKGVSYRLCATPTTSAVAPTAEAQVMPKQIVNSVSETSVSSLVDAALLSGLATPQCPVRPLTPVQLSRGAVTIAINRLLLTAQTRDRWGLRLQHGTRRLKAVQQNRFFSFHVFAAKQSQGTRIADTLRLVPARRAAVQDDGAEASIVDQRQQQQQQQQPAAATTHVLTHSFYLYYVEKVNRNVVRGHAELRRALHDAAQPPVSEEAVMSSTAPAAPPAISSLPPESVTLTVRQLPLLRLSVTVRRGGVGEGSALGPVGLQVDKDMRILAVFAGSPMARALTEAAGPLCSAHRLVQQRVEPHGATADTESAQHGDASSSTSKWDMLALPLLRARMEEVEACSVRSASSSPLPAAAAAQRQWAYELDEDSETATASSSRATPVAPVGADAAGVETRADVVALRALADAAAHTFQQLSLCSMVDGVHTLQTSHLHEYALRRLSLLRSGEGEEKEGEDVTGGLAALRAELEALGQQVRWEVVYAAQSNRPLRTPADLAAAFAPGVAEETISIQQFVED